MRTIALALIIAAGCAPPVSEENPASTVVTGPPSVQPPVVVHPTLGPRYNEVFQKATHNSY